MRIYDEMKEITEELKKLIYQRDTMTSENLRDLLDEIITLTVTIVNTTNMIMNCINEIRENYSVAESKIIENAKENQEAQLDNLKEYTQTAQGADDAKFISVMVELMKANQKTTEKQYNQLQFIHDISLLGFYKGIELNIGYTKFVLQSNDYGKREEQEQAIKGIKNTAAGAVPYISHIVTLYNIAKAVYDLVKAQDRETMQRNYFEELSSNLNFIEEQKASLQGILNHQEELYMAINKVLNNSKADSET